MLRARGHLMKAGQQRQASCKVEAKHVS